MQDVVRLRDGYVVEECSGGRRRKPSHDRCARLHTYLFSPFTHLSWPPSSDQFDAEMNTRRYARIPNWLRRAFERLVRDLTVHTQDEFFQLGLFSYSINRAWC